MDGLNEFMKYLTELSAKNNRVTIFLDEVTYLSLSRELKKSELNPRHFGGSSNPLLNITYMTPYRNVLIMNKNEFYRVTSVLDKIQEED